MGKKSLTEHDSRKELPLDLEQLVNRCMGRLDLVERLLASFEVRFPNELSQIEQSIDAGDVDHLVRLVHQLKGASANVSARGLYSILVNMEEAGRANQLEGAAAYLPEVHCAWDQFKGYKAGVCINPTQSASRTTAPARADDITEGKPSCAY